MYIFTSNIDALNFAWVFGIEGVTLELDLYSRSLTCGDWVKTRCPATQDFCYWQCKGSVYLNAQSLPEKNWKYVAWAWWLGHWLLPMSGKCLIKIAVIWSKRLVLTLFYSLCLGKNYPHSNMKITSKYSLIFLNSKTILILT